eukprot:365782-Chlamydomonas_euryale.AAC.2
MRVSPVIRQSSADTAKPRRLDASDRKRWEMVPKDANGAIRKRTLAAAAEESQPDRGGAGEVAAADEGDAAPKKATKARGPTWSDAEKLYLFQQQLASKHPQAHKFKNKAGTWKAITTKLNKKFRYEDGNARCRDASSCEQQFGNLQTAFTKWKRKVSEWKAANDVPTGSANEDGRMKPAPPQWKDHDTWQRVFAENPNTVGCAGWRAVGRGRKQAAGKVPSGGVSPGSGSSSSHSNDKPGRIASYDDGTVASPQWPTPQQPTEEKSNKSTKRLSGSARR